MEEKEKYPESILEPITFEKIAELIDDGGYTGDYDWVEIIDIRDLK